MLTFYLWQIPTKFFGALCTTHGWALSNFGKGFLRYTVDNYKEWRDNNKKNVADELDLSRIRTTPHQDNSPPCRYWSWWVVLLVGNGPGGELSWNRFGTDLSVCLLMYDSWSCTLVISSSRTLFLDSTSSLRLLSSCTFSSVLDPSRESRPTSRLRCVISWR